MRLQLWCELGGFIIRSVPALSLGLGFFPRLVGAGPVWLVGLCGCWCLSGVSVRVPPLSPPLPLRARFVLRDLF